MSVNFSTCREIVGGKNVRNPYSCCTPRLSTFRTSISPFVVGSVTDMAYVMDSAPRFLVRPLGYQLGRLNIARIAIGVFFEFGRSPWTFLAAYVLARFALLRSRSEHRPAGMTSASNPLADRLADKILSASARGQRERRMRVTCQPEVRV